MKLNLDKLGINTPTLLASAMIVAGFYEGIAASVATSAEAAKAATDSAKASVWGQCKRALNVAQENGHSPSTMRTGLEVAFQLAGVPSGTIRSYLPTLENLAVDVQNGTLTASEAVGISIADARKRYQVKPTPEQLAINAARDRLAEVTKDWTAEQLHLLCELAGESAESDAGADADAEPEREVVNG